MNGASVRVGSVCAESVNKLLSGNRSALPGDPARHWLGLYYAYALIDGEQLEFVY
ncbi:MAG: hypothetical protein JXA30_22445 [Deltaproteobacteria bacterium]|nr:hypothetical protein [Deltaproteobacteria bacterium]